MLLKLKARVVALGIMSLMVTSAVFPTVTLAEEAPIENAPLYALLTDSAALIDELNNDEINAGKQDEAVKLSDLYARLKLVKESARSQQDRELLKVAEFDLDGASEFIRAQ